MARGSRDRRGPPPLARTVYKSHTFDHQASVGSVTMFGLSVRAQAQVQARD